MSCSGKMGLLANLTIELSCTSGLQPVVLRLLENYNFQQALTFTSAPPMSNSKLRIFMQM